MAEIIQMKTSSGAINPDDPMATARRFVQRHFLDANGIQTLLHHRDYFHEYSGSSYTSITNADMRAKLWHLLENAKRKSSRADEGEPLAKVVPNPRMVNGILDALRAVVYIKDEVESPSWLGESLTSQPPANEMMSLSNGLLHIPSRRLIPNTPQFFTLSSSEIKFDATAPEPTRWLSFLDEIFAGDAETIAALREFMGYCMTHDTRFQKIGFLHGPRRSGKGTIIRMMEHLLGRVSTTAMTMKGLSTDFGRQALIGRMLATFPDARFNGIRDVDSLVEILLSVSGEDSVNIPRKFTADWSGRLHCKFLIASNDMPEFQDSSASLVSRFVVIRTQRTFIDQEDLELENKLIPELPGILNWALAGRDMLYDRRKFIQPELSKPLIRTMADSASIVSSFLERYCILGADEIVPRHKLLSTWEHWCTEIRGMKTPPGLAKLRSLLQSAVPRFNGDGPRTRDGKVRVYTYKGLRLKTNAELDADDPT